MDARERDERKKKTEKDRAQEIQSFELIFDIHKLYQLYQKSQEFHNYQSQSHFNRSWRLLCQNMERIKSIYYVIIINTLYAFICIRE